MADWFPDVRLEVVPAEDEMRSVAQPSAFDIVRVSIDPTSRPVEVFSRLAEQTRIGRSPRQEDVDDIVVSWFDDAIVLTSRAFASEESMLVVLPADEGVLFVARTGHALVPDLDWHSFRAAQGTPMLLSYSGNIRIPGPLTPLSSQRCSTCQYDNDPPIVRGMWCKNPDRTVKRHVFTP